MNAIDSPDRLTTPWNDYFAEMAVYHDTKGDAIIGGWKIWDVSSFRFFPCRRDTLSQIPTRRSEKTPIEPFDCFGDVESSMTDSN